MENQLFEFSYAKSLIEDEYACLKLISTDYKFNLLPSYAGRIKKGIHDHLTSLLKHYSESLGGILIAYKNICTVENQGTIFSEGRFIGVDIKGDFIIFCPEVGKTLKGVVNKYGQDYVGCLVHNCFNASMLRPENEEEWSGDNVDIGYEFLFRVTKIILGDKQPFFKGIIIDDSILAPSCIGDGRMTDNNFQVENHDNDYDEESEAEVPKQLTQKDSTMKVKTKIKKERQSFDQNDIKCTDTESSEEREANKSIEKKVKTINKDSGKKKKKRKRHTEDEENKFDVTNSCESENGPTAKKRKVEHKVKTEKAKKKKRETKNNDTQDNLENENFLNETESSEIEEVNVIERRKEDTINITEHEELDDTQLIEPNITEEAVNGFASASESDEEVNRERLKEMKQIDVKDSGKKGKKRKRDSINELGSNSISDSGNKNFPTVKKRKLDTSDSKLARKEKKKSKQVKENRRTKGKSDDLKDEIQNEIELTDTNLANNPEFGEIKKLQDEEFKDSESSSSAEEKQQVPPSQPKEVAVENVEKKSGSTNKEKNTRNKKEKMKGPESKKDKKKKDKSKKKDKKLDDNGKPIEKKKKKKKEGKREKKSKHKIRMKDKDGKEKTSKKEKKTKKESKKSKTKKEGKKIEK